MRTCPTCKNQYADDANFCPMDATKLLPPVAEVAPTFPPAATTLGTPSPSATVPATVFDQPRPVAGRFMLGVERDRTPTGVVYEASDLTNGEAVWLKLVDKQVLPSAMMADRALRELKQLAKVQSEHFVRIVDQGKDDGRIFVVSEASAGISLETLVDRSGPLSFERARTILLGVGEALAEAQKVGVIHRDVAPRNVLVDGDRIKLIDFGLAEAISDRVFGNPGFLSPEQAEGKPVDQRSNIYSLGALLYYMLTGSAPFVGERDSVVQQHLHAQPHPPSARRAGIFPEVDKLVLKAMEKSGGRRHLTLRQLLNEIAAISAPTPAALPPTADLGHARTVMQFGSSSEPAPPAKRSPTTPAKAAPAIPSKIEQETTEKVPDMPQIAATAAAAPAPARRRVPAGDVVKAPPPKPPEKAKTPEPVLLRPKAPEPVAARPAPAAPPPKPTGKKGFRETAWFKKGELEQEMAKAAAEQNPDDPLAGPALELAPDVDPATLTTEDRARLSLKTGRTEMMGVIKGPTSISGDRMSEEELLAEVDSSKRLKLVVGGVILAATVIGAGLYFLIGSKEPAPPKVENPPAATAPVNPAVPTH